MRVRTKNEEASPTTRLTVPTAAPKDGAETEADALELDLAVRFRQDQRRTAEAAKKKELRVLWYASR